jgi:hypothetical protein
MKKRFAQLVACYLALSLAFGGAVALSPILHVWIEHGGKAGPHTHLTLPPEVVAASHRQGVQHRHPDALDAAHELWHTRELSHPPSPASVSTQAHGHGLFVHSYEPFRPPNLATLRHSLHVVFHFLGGRAPASSEPAPPGDRPGHQHNSLPQLLAGGAVEQHLDFPLLQPVPVSWTFRVLPSHTPLLVDDWDAQMASRGPPSVRS